MAEETSSEDNFLELIDETKKALVVGPIVVNETFHGVCKRVASDFPIPVFEITRKVYDIGGPGNLLKNIKALGLAADLITMIGERDDYVVNTMESEDIDTTGVVTCPDYSVAKKIRYICNDYVSFRANEGNEGFIVDEVTETKILSIFKEKLNSENFSVVVLSDYRFGMLSERVSASIIALAKSKNLPVVVDPPKFGNFEKFKGCTLFKPNLDEARYFLGHAIHSKEEIVNACEEISHKLCCQYTILTLAEQGIAGYRKETGKCKIYPVQGRLNVVDVNGAGDTVLAVIAFGLSINIGIDVMCKLANGCAGNVIQYAGTVAVSLLDIVREQCKVLKRKGQVQNLLKIVPESVEKILVTGIISPITSLHLKSIKEAKQEGAIVLVTVEGKNVVDYDIEVMSDILVCNKYIDFIIIPADFDIEWLTRTVMPKLRFDLN